MREGGYIFGGCPKYIRGQFKAYTHQIAALGVGDCGGHLHKSYITHCRNITLNLQKTWIYTAKYLQLSQKCEKVANFSPLWRFSETWKAIISAIQWQLLPAIKKYNSCEWPQRLDHNNWVLFSLSRGHVIPDWGGGGNGGNVWRWKKFTGDSLKRSDQKRILVCRLEMTTDIVEIGFSSFF